MALTKKNSQPDPEKSESTEEDVYEPVIRRPFDDEVVDPYSGDDVKLRDPWADEEGESLKPFLPVRKPEVKKAPKKGDSE